MQMRKTDLRVAVLSPLKLAEAAAPLSKLCALGVLRFGTLRLRYIKEKIPTSSLRMELICLRCVKREPGNID